MTMVFEKIYLVGNGRIADDCLRILSKKQIQVTYVEVFAEEFSFTRKLCQRLGIELLHIDKPDMKQFLLDQEKDTLIFSVHNSYIFPREVVEKTNLTILNMHIAPLPHYRGMNAPTWEIYDQQKYAGVTWHEVAADIDAGGIIDQKIFDIDPDDTAMKVLQKSFLAGVELFEKNLDTFLKKTYKTKPMEEKRTKLYLGKDLPNEGYMDMSWNLDKAYAFLRSMDYSGANLMRLPRVEHKGETYEITKYRREIGNQSPIDKTVYEFAPQENTLKIHGGGIA